MKTDFQTPDWSREASPAVWEELDRLRKQLQCWQGRAAAAEVERDRLRAQNAELVAAQEKAEAS